MGRIKQEFSLYSRARKDGKKVYYYRTYDEFGMRTSGRCTGQTTKAGALNYCTQLFKENQLIPNSSDTLQRYIEKKRFFVFGECEYCTYKNLGKTYAEDCLSRMHNHILPTLGNVRFDNLTHKTIDAWQLKLLSNKTRTLSVKTIRECRNVLRIIMKSAYSDGFIKDEIFDKVKKLPQHTRKVRGILTEAEVQDLFDREKIMEYWDGNIFYYTACILACFTGMRQGEILALTPDQVFNEHIIVNSSWGKHGRGPTKTREIRKVYLKKELRELLNIIMPENGYIFSLDPNRKKPITRNQVGPNFYKALERMGIDKEARIERNITFHSFRHWMVTYLRGKGLTDAEITSITGQKTSSVIDDYTRFNLLDNRNVVNAIESITT